MIKIIMFLVFYFLIVPQSFAYLGPGIGGGVLAATLGVIVALFAVTPLATEVKPARVFRSAASSSVPPTVIE